MGGKKLPQLLNEVHLFFNISTVSRQIKRHILKSIWHISFVFVFLREYTTEYKISPEASWQASSGVALNVPSVIRRQQKTKFRSRSGYRTGSFLNTVVWHWKKEDTNTFGSSLKHNTKKCGSILGVCWDRSVCEWREGVGTEFHSQQDQVSWCCQSHALESSSVTLGFGEFEISLKNSSSFSMLWYSAEGKKYINLTTESWNVKCKSVIYSGWLGLTVRFWMPSEKAPICLTVPSESSIWDKKQISTLVTIYTW